MKGLAPLDDSALLLGKARATVQSLEPRAGSSGHRDGGGVARCTALIRRTGAPQAAACQSIRPPVPIAIAGPSARALSKLSPIEPIEGMAPISASRSPYRTEVNCDPALE